MAKKDFSKGEIVIYRTPQKEVKLDVCLEKETVWLTQKQMAILFEKGIPTINEHIKNIYKEKEKFKELQNTINFLQEKSQKELLLGQAGEILNLLSSYAKTLTLLEEYDKRKLKEIKGRKAKFVLKYEKCERIITEIRKELIAKKKASNLFGQETDGRFEGIIKGLYQTFDRNELYPTIEDKASHLLYFIIKDHPFVERCFN